MQKVWHFLAHALVPMATHGEQPQRNTMEAYVQRVLEERRWEVEVKYSRSSVGKPVKNLSPLADLIIERFLLVFVCVVQHYLLLSLSRSCEGARVNGKLDGVCRAVFKDGHFYEVPQIIHTNYFLHCTKIDNIFVCECLLCCLLLCAGGVQ